ncbi:hypothetical protein B0H10DRAFT_2363067 [Mycena sp. CBHHK59/15]|nr:hypothetical protein B0H10DRAFT_2363067 [Mycena sp. CBHHK59/15]
MGSLFDEGTTDHEITRAQFGVLGSGPKFGFWSWPERSAPRMVTYRHGEMMLQREWPSDATGWMLPLAFIPRLLFSTEFPPPTTAQPDQITDWKSWYAWRGLPMASPAAILMDAPLTVYYLLTKILDVIDPARTAERRQQLIIHYLGAETELNFVPLFSELALLLPYVDIVFVFISRATHSLVRHAKKCHPSSVAAQASESAVWTYEAPPATGSGRITIFLEDDLEIWTHPMTRKAGYKKAHALIALNAGLCTYSTWTEVLTVAAVTHIPFASTDYCEDLAAQCVRKLPPVWDNAIRVVPGMDDEHKARIKSLSYPLTVNPFHRPGIRNCGQRLPYVYNGFTFSICLPK